jgi:ParE toxin of type II toxin-antitoxin system, parDE
MKYHLDLKDPVNDEIVDAFKYYENEQTLLGYRLLDTIEIALAEILINPLACQIRCDVYRTKLVSPFPYHIIYEVNGKDVIVYQFLGARKEPAKRFKK